MAGITITESQFRVVSQPIQERTIRLELLNYQYQTVDSLEGVCTAGSINIDANSDIRRTASLTIAINDKSDYEVRPGGRVWLDKFVKVFVGTYDLLTGEIEWTNCGIYIIDAPSYSFNATDNTLSVTLLDLMAKLTGTRDGYLPGVPMIIKMGESIREAIIDTLALGGFTQYVVDNPPSPGTVPYDLEFGQGSSIYDILAALRDLYPDYEIYFDTEGVFYYKEIPNGLDDPVLIDDTTLQNIVISESTNTDFQYVKNSIEVYGRSHDPDFYTETVSISGTESQKNISLTYASLTEPVEDVVYGFMVDSMPVVTGGTFSMVLKNETSTLLTARVYLSDGETAPYIPAEMDQPYYCFTIRKRTSGAMWFEWLGHLQAYGSAEDDNADSPYYVNGTVGRIHEVLYGSDYDNCYSDDLAQQRAEYELWLKTNMNVTTDLTTVVVPWIDVNILCEYTSKRNEITDRYLIKSVQMGLAPDETMSINMIKFYPTDNINVPEYDQVEYIEASSGCGINTEYQASSNTTFAIQCEINEGNSNTGYLFGCMNSTTGSYSVYHISTLLSSGEYQGSLTMYYGSSIVNLCTYTTTYDTTSWLISMSENVVTVKGTVANGVIIVNDTKNVPLNQFTQNDNFYIFGISNNGSFLSQPGYKLYSFNIRENNSMVRNFVPVVGHTNGVGLLDIINNTFYENIGTGVFTPGEPVPNPII